MSDRSDVSYISEEGDVFGQQQQQRGGGPAQQYGGRGSSRRPPGAGSRISHASSLGSSAVGDDLLQDTAAAATSWQEVDREQLSATVLKLISSVASTAPTDDKSREAVVWHPAAVAVSHGPALNDPLGFGRIDLANLRLERGPAGAADAGGAGGQSWQGEGASRGAMAASRQGKGTVGRFFSELARNDPQVSPAAGGIGYAGSPLGSAAAAAGTPGGGLPGPSAAAAALLARQGSVPLAREKLLPSEEGFDPETYLAIFHGESSAPQLAAGVRALERELGESTGQLKQLVKQNFERFISCKTTIDDIYTKLHRIESNQTGLSTEVLYRAIQEVQDGASDVFGPILERSAKAERIRSVQLLLKRFSGLFSAPQRVTALGAARDYEQVTAEWKKANGLIKPGPRTNQVWASLYAEIEQRVAEVYAQQCREVEDPQLPADTATALVGHMLALQAEGLPAAQGQDPLVLLLAARERQFAADMSAAAADHERAVLRLKAAMAAAAGGDEKGQDPGSITDAQMLRWQGSWDSSSSGSSSSRHHNLLHRQGLGSPAGSPTAAAAASGAAVFARALSGYRGAVPAAAGDAAIAALEAVTGPSTAATAAAAAAAAAAVGVAAGSSGAGSLRRAGGGGGGLSGVLGLGGRGQHLAELAPLSGLQPPAPRSRIVSDMQCTAGEELYLRHLEGLSAVLLECLPGFWQAAGPNKLTLPPNLPAAAAAKLQETMNGAGGITARLVDTYCQAADALTQGIAGVGPLREALLCAAEDLAACVSELESQQAPASALAAVRRVLGAAVASGVQQLVGHLQAVAPVLVAREGWQLSLTHSGDLPVTLLPEQLQEEVTVAMQFYQQLLECATGHSSSSSAPDGAGGGSVAAAVAKLIGPDKCTKPIRDAYFACLEDFIKCMASTDHLRPAGPAAAAAAGSAEGSPRGGSSRAQQQQQQRRPGMSAAAAAAILGRESWEDTDVEAEGTFDATLTAGGVAGAGLTAAAAAAAAGGGGAGAGGHVLRLVLSDDVKLLLIGSNLGFMREKLVGGLTQRFLLTLTGENASELQRCSRYVVKLAGRLDATIQAVNTIYTDRKRRAVDRLLAAYVQADGSSVGVPPTLSGVSPQAQQLVQLVAAVQAETFTYARPFMHGLMSTVLEHLGSSLTTAFTRLPVGVVGTLPAPQTSAAAAAAAAAAADGAAAGCPIEALGQYYMDLVYLDAALGKAGPASLSTDLSAACHLLSTRICPPSDGGRGLSGRSERDRSAAETPLAKSLLSVRDPQELTSKLQVTCRKALGDVLERSAFTLRSLLPAPAAS